MKIGDVVIPNRLSNVVLSSGCNRYNFAIVVNINPFVMVSEYGDMLWSCQDIFDYVSLCQAHPDIVNVAMTRYKNYNKN